MFNRINLAAALIALSASLCAPAWSESDGAKGLFYEQLDKPAASMNTGVQYWIELHRAGKTMRVNNKMAFRSGDKIRFHVKSNVDAYAYILLKEGSGGEQAVLFPDASQNDETKVVHGRDYPIPNKGFLTFDENPGTEKLLLLLSRNPVDATAYLNNDTNDRAQIAALPDGSKDLIPAKIVLAYEPPKDAFKPKPALPETTTISVSSTGNKTNKTGKPAKVATGGSKPAADKNKVADKPHTTSKPHTQVATKPTNHVTSESSSDDGDGVTITDSLVTVVNRDPAAVLALDLSLDHTR